MADACVFCGAEETLTREHVWPNWLSRVWLADEPAVVSAGPLNRSPRTYGVDGTMKPFQMTVKAVCAKCNHGWMSELESRCQSILAPMILGRPQTIDSADQAALALWGLKTALIGMLVSPEADRAKGYGVPPSEYRALYEVRDQRRLPDNVQVWLGRYGGESLRASTQITPMVVTVGARYDPGEPHAYVFTIVVGRVLIQGVRFTTPSLHVELKPRQEFAQLWPGRTAVVWPYGVEVGDDDLRAVQKGSNLMPTLADVQLRPFGPAVDLEASRSVNGMVQLPTPCGQHSVMYPQVLVEEAFQGHFYRFMTMCGCGMAYLVQTESDGAHFKCEGTPEAISAAYEESQGEEVVFSDSNGIFFCKFVRAE